MLQTDLHIDVFPCVLQIDLHISSQRVSQIDIHIDFPSRVTNRFTYRCVPRVLQIDLHIGVSPRVLQIDLHIDFSLVCYK